MKKLILALLCTLALINSTTVQAIRTDREDGASWPPTSIHGMQQHPVRSACLAAGFTCIITTFVAVGSIIASQVSGNHDDYQEKTLILRASFGSFLSVPLYFIALKLLQMRSRRLGSGHREVT